MSRPTNVRPPPLSRIQPVLPCPIAQAPNDDVASHNPFQSPEDDVNSLRHTPSIIVQCGQEVTHTDVSLELQKISRVTCGLQQKWLSTNPAVICGALNLSWRPGVLRTT
ncbi:hypothetical protein E2C01_031915 [Portunus trituberculatus]|uniref:Uncharacterized protein n=1 Tax=Portunus trituberculatus TaxID=210409 RepID=A0A5B7EZG1_PORTR|nr:hypothetical protein [Portunus trituberculatus]